MEQRKENIQSRKSRGTVFQKVYKYPELFSQSAVLSPLHPHTITYTSLQTQAITSNRNQTQTKPNPTFKMTMIQRGPGGGACTVHRGPGGGACTIQRGPGGGACNIQ